MSGAPRHSSDEHSEIDELVQRACRGDTSSLEELLQRFQPLIQSYTKLALYASVNYRDPVMVGFVCAYGKDPAEGAVVLRDRLLAQNLPEDIRQEIVLTFLECVRKAPSNLQYAFRRDCIRKLGALARSSGKRVSLHSLEDPDPELGHSELGYRDELALAQQGLLDSEELWVCGLTERACFEKLTERQRAMLVDLYLNRLDAEEMRTRYGRSAMRECRQLVRWLRKQLFTGFPEAGSASMHAGNSCPDGEC